ARCWQCAWHCTMPAAQVVSDAATRRRKIRVIPHQFTERLTTTAMMDAGTMDESRRSDHHAVVVTGGRPRFDLADVVLSDLGGDPALAKRDGARKGWHEPWF